MLPPKEQVMKSYAIQEKAGDFDNKDEIWFNFERQLEDVNYYLRANMQLIKHWCLIFGVIYIALVYIGKSIMKNKQRYQLRGFLFFWNLIMAAWSIFLVARVGPFTIRKILHSNYYGQICDGHYGLEAPAVTLTFFLVYFVFN